MNRLILLGLVVLGALYVLFSSIYIVNERNQAIVMRFGQITDVKMEPGLYFKLPTDFVDTVQIVEDRVLRYDLPDITVQVKGGKLYQVDAFLTYKITNPRLFRQVALGSIQVAEARIESQFTSALRSIYSQREFDAALSAERAAMMRGVRDLITPNANELGIEIVDVRILRTDLTEGAQQTTFELMKAERLAEAAFLRARGQEAAQTIRAIAQRQAIEIRASANRDAEIIKGEGDAERNAIFAQAFGADPEFFEFYRSMQAYRTSLGATGTTMLLSPDSEFFSYFNGDTLDGAVPSPAAPNGIVPLPNVTVTVPEGTDIPVETVIDTPADAVPPADATPPAETTPAQ